MTLTVSDAAINLIVTEEDSNEAYYNRHYTHFEWPEGASGPTIGIGYDCGYVTRDEAHHDWDGIVDPAMIPHILEACGLKGGDAAAFVARKRNTVTVTWDQAMREFKEREVPKWLTRLGHALPNLDLLKPDSLGALLSLTYNRGAGGYDNPGPRFAEMRAIKGHMLAENFIKIPDDIRSMRRLWPMGGDLWRRRLHEADLFEKGLNNVA